MNLNVEVLNPLVALIAGILILIMPRLLNYVVAIYLIVIGILSRGFSISSGIGVLAHSLNSDLVSWRCCGTCRSNSLVDLSAKAAWRICFSASQRAWVLKR